MDGIELLPEQQVASGNNPEFAYQDAYNFVASVAYDLSGYIDEETSRKMTDSLETASGILSKLGVQRELFDPENTRAWESGVILLNLAMRWDAANSITERKIVANQLAALYTPEEADRLYRMADPIHGSVLTEPVVTELLKRAWPESNGDPYWVRDNIVVNHVAMLPYSKNSPDPSQTLETVLDDIYDHLDVPHAERVIVDGFASSDLGVYFAPLDTSQHKIDHETNHITKPGVRLGRLRVGLNEGLTEWQTLIDEGQDPMHIGSLKLAFMQEYADEIYLLQTIGKINPQLIELLLERYNNDSLSVSHSATLTLIDQFGLDGYMQICLEQPGARNDNKTGYLKGYDLAEHLATQQLN